MKKYDEKGRELMDPTPMAMPAGFKRPATLQEQLVRHMRAAERLAQQNGQESFEEANDFDCDDDKPDYSTPWEETHEGAFDEEFQLEMERERRKRNPPKQKVLKKKAKKPDPEESEDDDD